MSRQVAELVVNPDMPRIGSKCWIAWKLVQLAHRFHDAEYYERIVIRDEHGEVGEFVIVGDTYGCGVSSYSGPSGGYGGSGHYDPDLYQFGSCDVTWEEFTPDWLTDAVNASESPVGGRNA